MKKLMNVYIKWISNNKLSFIILVCFLLLLAMSVNQYLSEVHQFEKTIHLVVQSGKVLPYHYIPEDTFSIFFRFFSNYPLSMMMFLLPLLAVITGTYSFYIKQKKGFFRYITMRKSYREYIKKEIFSAWKPCLMVLFCLTFCFFVAFLLSGSFSVVSNSVLLKFESTPWIYTVHFFIRIALITIFFINIALLFVKRAKNYFLTVLLSFLTIVIFMIFSELFLGPIVSSIMHNNDYLNRFSIIASTWGCENNSSLLFTFMYFSILALGSTLLVFWTYRSEEEVNICAEK